MKIKNVIFDLYGVLFYLKSIQILRQIGLFNSLKFFLFYKKTPYRYHYILLDKMRKEVPGEYQNEIAFRGNFLPKSLCLWQQGKLSSQQVLEKILIFLNKLKKENYFRSSWEYSLFDKGFKSVYITQNRISAMQQNKKLIFTIKNLKRQKYYKFFMLTNVDYDLFENLLEIFPDVFALFDDVITSCHTQLIKPQKEIFEHLMSKHQLNTNECFFIDDQQENIDTAQKLGIQGLLYTKKIDINTYL